VKKNFKFACTSLADRANLFDGKFPGKNNTFHPALEPEFRRVTIDHICLGAEMKGDLGTDLPTDLQDTGVRDDQRVYANVGETVQFSAQGCQVTLTGD